MVIDNVDELNDQISKFLKFEKDLKDYLISYFKNKSISLEDRWVTFRRIGRLLPICSWVIVFEELEKNNLDWYDHFDYVRYATVKFTDIIDRCEGKTGVDLDALKEEILESSASGFIFDW